MVKIYVHRQNISPALVWTLNNLECNGLVIDSLVLIESIFELICLFRKAAGFFVELMITSGIIEPSIVKFIMVQFDVFRRIGRQIQCLLCFPQ